MARTGDFRLDEINFETLTLERMPFQITEYFSPEVLATMKLDAWQDMVLQRMAYKLTGEILAEKLIEERIPVQFKKDVFFPFPLNWWQHLKDAKNDALIFGWLRWVPRRIALHLIGNVKMKTRIRTVSQRKYVTATQLALFPQHKIMTPPDLRGPVAVRYEQWSVS